MYQGSNHGAEKQRCVHHVKPDGLRGREGKNTITEKKIDTFDGN